MREPEVVYKVGDRVRVYSHITRSLVGEAVLIKQHPNPVVFMVREEWSGGTSWVCINRMQPAVSARDANGSKET